jgi:DNA-binding NtrC family response regulator
MASTHVTSAACFGQQEDLGEDGLELQGVSPGAPVLLGKSPAVRRLHSQIRRIAPYFRTALIRGEPGSGKELVARCLHAGSAGADGPFLAAQAEALAELFARGEAVHPTAKRSADLLLESVYGGTLYMKGVAELSFGLQAGLLRFLRACEQRRATPASTRRAASRTLAIRILAATGADLSTVAAVGQFRQDLYAYLSAVEIQVPPLRERVEDIPALAEWVLGRAAGPGGKLLAEATTAQLQRALWPGNLRQFERVLAQAATLAEGTLIEPRHLLALVETGGNSPAVEALKTERLHDVIVRHVLKVLEHCGGNKVRAAEALGISRSTLYRMLEAQPAPRLATSHEMEVSK